MFIVVFPYLQSELDYILSPVYSSKYYYVSGVPLSSNAITSAGSHSIQLLKVVPEFLSIVLSRGLGIVIQLVILLSVFKSSFN